MSDQNKVEKDTTEEQPNDDLNLETGNELKSKKVREDIDKKNTDDYFKHREKALGRFWGVVLRLKIAMPNEN